MTFCLNAVIIRPENGIKIKKAIILLHGYGGDGKDISMLSLNWKRHMPNTVFICPNGHETWAMNPSGYQWFDLSKEEPSYILEQSIKAENVIKKFIEEVKLEFNLEPKKIFLSWGEDYQLLFTVGQENLEKIQNNLNLSVIGHITSSKEMILIEKSGRNIMIESLGWKSF